MRARSRLAIGLWATIGAGSAAAQASSAVVSAPAVNAAGEEDEEEVVVAGGRARGSIVADVRPERVFRAADIRAFGADDVVALLGVIGTQTASNRGRGDEAPVTLLNGRRVSNLAEIARIPAEAIQRMEIFPEEVALRYGYRADQKVVNVVTFQRFRSVVGQAGYAAPTAGGRRRGDGDADALVIRGDTRLGLGATYSRAANLLEHDRGLIQPPGAAALGRDRTLLPSTERLRVEGVASGPVLAAVTATLDASVERDRSRGLLGRSPIGTLRRDDEQDAVHVGATLGGSAGTWRWTALGNLDRRSARTLVDQATGGRESVRIDDALAGADLIVAGPLTSVPAGTIIATLHAAAETRDLATRPGRGSGSPPGSLGRDRIGVQLNLDVPLLGDAAPGGSRLGRLSANLDARVDRLSDAGTSWSYGAVLSWWPARALGVIVAGTSEQAAPDLGLIGGAALSTPNVRTLDGARGEVVEVTQRSGGNPLLRRDERRVTRLGVNLRPLSHADLTLSLDYAATRLDDPVTTLPLATPQVEAAFPDRFRRDGSGRLVEVDARPLNAASSRLRQLRWGINLTRPLGPTPPGMADGTIRIPANQAGQMTQEPNGSVTFRPMPGSDLARNITRASSRIFVSLYHDWTLEDSLLLRRGLPTLDLLSGDAVDVTGGRRRHRVEFQAGAFRRGLGARLDATWRSGLTVDQGEAGAGALRVDSLVTVDLALFVDLAERLRALPRWLSGARVSVDIDNVFDRRADVRDRLGATPLTYQRGYLDPLGRTVAVRLRKLL
ncbi:TonB-dependent receptor [Sphingomonas sp. RHCKR7]|uniref:TonB-dependent receptor n=1 Tax=Sphingomonas folli TaxID=2862497 RepID=UPI001CA48CB6|nr:TonB-dependent receptor [Sphingomonas folli]MBW6526458.1 TonB-dependent receptor [Sphingomonas folli]